MIVADEKSKIAAAARAVRGMLDLSQVEMANRAATSSQTVALLEHGELSNPRRMIIPICNAAGITLDEFSLIMEIGERAAQRMKIATAESGG